MYVPKKIINHNGQDVLMLPMDIEYTQREISVYGEINSELAAALCSALRVLNRESDSDISLYINSPGGSVSDGFYIYDTIKELSCDVRTIAVGRCSSMAAFLVATAGSPQKRFVQPNAELLIHQPLGFGIQGQASDIRIHAEHILKIRNKINKYLADATGQSIEKIEADTDRDNIMNASEAIEYGLVDALYKG